VTLEQVHAAAAKYLSPSNRTIGWFEPERDPSGQSEG